MRVCSSIDRQGNIQVIIVNIANCQILTEIEILSDESRRVAIWGQVEKGISERELVAN